MSLPWKGALEVALCRLGTWWDAGSETIFLIAVRMVRSWEAEVREQPFTATDKMGNRVSVVSEWLTCVLYKVEGLKYLAVH